MVVDNKTGGLDYVWNWSEGDGKRKFVMIPTCVLWAIMNTKIKLVEIKVILFICRMSYGFRGNKDATRSLELWEFTKCTNISENHISEIINGLVESGFIFRKSGKGRGHIYAINLKCYGVEMRNSQKTT